MKRRKHQSSTAALRRGPGRVLLWAAMLLAPAAFAQPQAPQHGPAMHGTEHGDMNDMKDMDHGSTNGIEHGDMKNMPHDGAPRDADHDFENRVHQRAAPAIDHGAMDMGAMDMGAMQGGTAPPDARDPDAYADGLEPRHLPGMDMADNDPYGQLLLDRLEGWRGRGAETGVRLDAQAWFGTDLNKLWLKVEGSRSRGTPGATRGELLYSRAFTPYFGWQAGLRHDFGGGGPGRDWAAFGVQGLAPYWFDVEATAYLGPSGRTALRLKAEYDLRITQRLVLQPDVELNGYGRSDRERGIGSGLSSIDAGLRLRYELTRKFAPYLGLSWDRRFGRSADFAREAGREPRETRFVAGVRLWF